MTLTTAKTIHHCTWIVCDLPVRPYFCRVWYFY